MLLSVGNRYSYYSSIKGLRVLVTGLRSLLLAAQRCTTGT
ncbi:MAG: hypothetical protein ACI94O_002435, partial [Octadecabacter sp.]